MVEVSWWRFGLWCVEEVFQGNGDDAGGEKGEGPSYYRQLCMCDIGNVIRHCLGLV